MPFNFNDPRLTQEYETPQGRARRYWPHKHSIEHLAYSPDQVRSWKTIRFSSSVNDLSPTNQQCKLQCNEAPVNSYYPEFYLRKQLLQQQPGLIPALQNTRSFRQVSGQPLDLVKPHLTHQRKKSRYHITMPRKYREALCKITENIYNNPEVDKFNLLKTNGGDVASNEVRNIPNKPELSPFIYNLDSTSKRTKVNQRHKTSSPAFFNQRRSKNKDRLPPINKDALPLLRRTKEFFPFQVKFDLNSVSPDLHMKRYIWGDGERMETMCINYSGHALFKESPSREAVAAKISSENKFHDKKIVGLRDLLQSKIPHDTKKLYLNEPTQKGPAVSQDTQEFSHYGLLEEAKASALDNCLRKLYRREEMSEIPPALLHNSYGHGHITRLPKKFGFVKHQLPHTLQEDTPPLPYEIQRVENAMRKKMKVRRDKKAQGVQSEESVSEFIEQFAKPTIALSQNEALFEKKKSFVRLSDYSTKNNELNSKDSPDLLSYQVGAVKMGLEGKKVETKPMGKTVVARPNRDNNLLMSTELRAKSSESLEKQGLKLEMGEEIEINSILNVGQQSPTLGDFSSLDGSSCSDNDGSVMRLPVLQYYGNAKDSRELLPWPDTMYSKISIPNQVAQMLGDNQLYQTLLKDQTSSSSTENEDNSSDDEEEDEYNLEEEESQTSVELGKIFNGIMAYMKREST